MTASAEQARPVRARRRDPVTWIVKPAIWVVWLLPFAWLLWLVLESIFLRGRGLGSNPTEFINKYTGEWAIRFFLIALAVTPVRIVGIWKQAGRVRRLLGLFAFFYAMLHMLSYVGLDRTFSLVLVWRDLVGSWYISTGIIALLLLLPLALTSTKGWIRRIGGKRWNNLHKTVYVAGAFACWHFFMMRKGVQVEPLIYAGIFLSLMAVRAWKPLKRRFIAKPA